MRRWFLVYRLLTYQCWAIIYAIHCFEYFCLSLRLCRHQTLRHKDAHVCLSNSWLISMLSIKKTDSNNESVSTYQCMLLIFSFVVSTAISTIVATTVVSAAAAAVSTTISTTAATATVVVESSSRSFFAFWSRLRFVYN